LEFGEGCEKVSGWGHMNKYINVGRQENENERLNVGFLIFIVK
jgi:hypothetical protein